MKGITVVKVGNFIILNDSISEKEKKILQVEKDNIDNPLQWTRCSCGKFPRYDCLNIETGKKEELCSCQINKEDTRIISSKEIKVKIDL